MERFHEESFTLLQHRPHRPIRDHSDAVLAAIVHNIAILVPGVHLDLVYRDRVAGNGVGE